MNIYHYNRLTGEYVSSGKARKSPLDNNYLIPANATKEQPPKAGVNEVAVFEENSWTLKPDYRGQVYYTPEGKEIIINEIGVKKQKGWLDEKPYIPPTWEEIRSMRNGLLSQSDWTVLSDAPLNSSQKTSWKAYRQELRDIPSKFKNAKDVVWPDMP